MDRFGRFLALGGEAMRVKVSYIDPSGKEIRPATGQLKNDFTGKRILLTIEELDEETDRVLADWSPEAEKEFIDTFFEQYELSPGLLREMAQQELTERVERRLLGNGG